MIYYIFHGPKMQVGTSVPMEVRANPPLSLEGRQHAAEVGEHLRGSAGPPTKFWASPLVRAVQTAEIIARVTGYEGVIDTTDLRIAQFASNEDGEVTFMPEHADNWYDLWQREMVEFNDMLIGQIQPGERYFIASHRGTIASLIADYHDIHDIEQMRKIALTKKLVSLVGFIALHIKAPGEVELLFDPIECKLVTL